MAEYIVARKADGVEVYRYQSDAPVEWNGMDNRRLFINAGLPDDEDGHDNQHVFLRALPA